MRFDFSKLRGRIVEHYGTLAAFAKAYGISENSLSLKMNNKTKFSSGDIIKISDMLEIKKDEIGDYFFKTKV